MSVIRNIQELRLRYISEDRFRCSKKKRLVMQCTGVRQNELRRPETDNHFDENYTKDLLSPLYNLGYIFANYGEGRFGFHDFVSKVLFYHLVSLFFIRTYLTSLFRSSITLIFPVLVSSQLIQCTVARAETKETHWQNAWETYNLNYIFLNIRGGDRV